MKTIFNFLLVILSYCSINSPVFAQNVEIKWGEDVNQAPNGANSPKQGVKYNFVGETMYGKHFNSVDFTVKYVSQEMNTSKPWHLYTISGRNESVEINPDGFRISSVQVARDSNNNFLCIGFYTDKWNTQQDGIFKMVVDSKTGKQISKNTWHFNEDFLNHFMNEKKAKKGKPLECYKMIGIVSRKDGGFSIIAEYQLLDATPMQMSKANNPDGSTIYGINAAKDNNESPFSNRQYASKTNGIYRNAFVLNVKPDFSMNWVAVVPKNQDVLVYSPTVFHSKYTPEEYLSVAWFSYGENIYLFYNDKPENLNITDYDKLGKLTNMDNTEVVAAEIDRNGIVKKQSLFKNKDMKDGFVPTSCVQENPNSIKFYAKIEKGYKSGTFILKD